MLGRRYGAWSADEVGRGQHIGTRGGAGQGRPRNQESTGRRKVLGDGDTVESDPFHFLDKRRDRRWSCVAC